MAWDDWLIGGGSDSSTGNLDGGGNAGYNENYGNEGYSSQSPQYQAPSYDPGYFSDTSSMSYAPQQSGAYWDSIFSTQAPNMSYAPQAAPAVFTPGAGPSNSQANQWAGIAPSAAPAASSAPAFGDYLSGAANKTEGMLGGIEAWGRQNPRLASALTQGVGLLANARAQSRANDLTKQQLAMQQQAQTRNTAIADQRNQLATQQINQALSLYNPQELGQRGMAQAQADTGRQLQQLEQQMASRGYSPADIAAAKRRAQVGGATAATQGYMQGYDTGRGAQQGALSSAVGLGQQYATPADMSNTASALRNAGVAAGQSYTSLLGGMLGNPTLEATKRTEEASSAATRKRLGLPTQ